MTRIAFPSIAHNLAPAASAASSTDALQLDADCFSFSERAADFSTLASFSAVGLAGRLASYSVMATRIASRFLPVAAQLASISAEASLMTAWGAPESTRPLLQDFKAHFVNFATFRIMGGSSHLAQSAAMMAGHQVTSCLGLEEASRQSLLRQFFEANLSTFQIQAGQHLSQFASGSRLERLATQRSQTRSEDQAIHSESILLRNRASEPPDESARKSVPPEDPLDRLNAPRVSPPPQKPDFDIFKKELHDFHYALDLRVSSCTNGIHNNFFKYEEEGLHYSFFSSHFNLCGSKSRGVFKVITYRGNPEALVDLKGLLSERLNGFASAIRYFEAAGTPASDTLALREILYQSYDRVQVLRECMRIFAVKSPAQFSSYYEALFRAYHGLQVPFSEQTAQLRRNTHITQMVTDDVVKRWANDFFFRNQWPYTAVNAQIIMGRVRYLRGIRTGSEFYAALRQSQNTHPYFPLLPIHIIFDPTTGLIVSFADSSEAARKSITDWHNRDYPFQTATLWIDPIEGGDIRRVTLSSPIEDARIRRALEELVGLQVLPGQRVQARDTANAAEAPAWNISFQWNVSENPEAEIYRVVEYHTIPIGNPPVPWRYLILDNAAHPNLSDSQQLWVLESDLDGIFAGALVKLVKRS